METLLFLIIIGVLSTIFGKGKGNKRFEKNKPFTTNTFEDIKKFLQTEIQKENQTENKEVIQKTIQKKVTKEKQEFVDTLPKWSSPQQVETQKIKIREQETKKVEESPQILSEKPDADTLINGIIWSEILGEPRSKKPYFLEKR